MTFIQNNGSNGDKHLNGLEFYLYRNPTHSGYHFYVFNETIYPDFVLWVRQKDGDANKQVIIYIEPHGLVHSDPNNDAKLNLPSFLNKLHNNINRLNTYAFIVSVTDWDKLDWKNKTKSQLEGDGIVFQSDQDYIEKILRRVLNKP